MKTLQILFAAAFAMSTASAIERPVPPSVLIESVQFRQRYPWNGLVDIDAKITCSDPATNLAVYVAAWDNVKDRALTVKTIWVEGDETKNPDLVAKSGTTRFVWDARADNPGEISSDVSISVQAYVRDMRYLVIDLTGGASATEYEYSFMADPPEGGWTDEYKTNKLVLRLIPAGTFIMGSPKDEVGRYDNETQHRVTLTRPFYMGIFETTQRQYELVNGTRPSYFNNNTYYAPRPVENLSRDTIRGNSGAYQWLQTAEVAETSFMGLMRIRTGIGSFDLPTEAQWEYACRAGSTTAFNNGVNLLTTNVNWDQNLSKLGRYNVSSSAATEAVGCYLPNDWGLYDMHGNVAELCLNFRFNIASDYSSAPVIDPRNSSDIYCLFRGGYWQTSARNCRSACRGTDVRYVDADDYSSYIGFRLYCDADLTK